MSARRVIIDENRMEEANDRNFDHYADDYFHPKLTPKKTFFDLHRHRRRNGAETSESENNFHPRIQWSAGTTNIGSGCQIGPYDDSVTRDIMKPVLQRASSTPDPASIFGVSRRHLPPLPDTWGSIDVQPTQPEEIQHLLVPSPVIRRTHISEDTVKPKRKFMKKFLKRSNAAVSNTGLESSRALNGDVCKSRNIFREGEQRFFSFADEIETIKPEEEFKLLNERYLREGIIPVESLTEENIDISEPTSPQMRFDLKKGNVAKERKSLIRMPLNERHVAIDTDDVECRSPEESSTSPLPARRSCEPLDVENLRRLRGSEVEPETSGVGQWNSEYPERNGSEIFDTAFSTKTSTISIADDDGDDESEICSKGDMNSEAFDINAFKIDNPFSDFSLKNINREKTLLRQQTAETTVETAARHRDLAVPSTSKGAYAMEIHRQTVDSRTKSVEQSEKKSREQSFFQSAASRLRKASLSDDAAFATSSQRLFTAIEESLILKNCAKERQKQSETLRLGGSFLYAVIQQVGDESCNFASIVLRDDRDDFSEEDMVFHCYDRNFHVFLALLMNNIINPTFDSFWKNYPLISLSGYSERSVDTVSVMVKNSLWFEIIGFFQTAWPKAIDDVVNITRDQHGNMLSVYSEVVETGVVGIASDSAQSCNVRTTTLFPLVPDDSDKFLTIQSNELLDQITRRVVNSVFSQNLIREIRFLLSVRPMTSLIPSRHNYESSCFLGLETYWPLTNWPVPDGFFGTPIAFLLEPFFDINESHNHKNCASFGRFCLSLIRNTMTKLSDI